MGKILKYKEIAIYYSIYIKVFFDGKFSYITVSTDDVLKTNNNETEFTELRRVFEEAFDMKVQEGYFLKCLNLGISQSPLGFSVYHTDKSMKLVHWWLPTGTFRKVDTTFRTDSTYEK